MDNSRLGQPLTDMELKSYFSPILDAVIDIPGDVIECGIWKGFSGSVIYGMMLDKNMNKKFWGFDSWEKMPSTTKEDRSLLRTIAKNVDHELNNPDTIATELDIYCKMEDQGISPEDVKKNVRTVGGWFSHTLPNEIPKNISKISFAHLDVDTYESYKTCINNIWPVLSKGGIIALDEYSDIWWPGCRMAVDEFLLERLSEFDLLTAKIVTEKRTITKQIIRKVV